VFIPSSFSGSECAVFYDDIRSLSKTRVSRVTFLPPIYFSAHNTALFGISEVYYDFRLSPIRLSRLLDVF
jgi:hypothetical protein